MTKVKICGLKSAADIVSVNKYKPDFIGFILAKGFKRSIDFDTAKTLKNALDKSILSTGVFVNDDISDICRLCHSGVTDVIQLHGDEDEDYISKVKKLTNKTVIKAFKVESEQDIRRANACGSDLILLDNGTGTGKSFDWSLLNRVCRPFILAGGVNAENVKRAIKEFKPYAVDVSSYVETDGVKDEQKIKQFIEAARVADKESL